MNPRIRRLMADWQTLRVEFAGHPRVRVEPLGWDPPEQYRVTYSVPGVRLDAAGQPIVVDKHEVMVKLGAGYPRQKPFCTAETPVFHPNFGVNAGDEICIGDYWTPAQTLADIIIKIGDMLQYKVYNTLSPLNATAGRWAAQNKGLFPVGDDGLYQAEPVIVLGDVSERTEPVRLKLLLDDPETDTPDELVGAGVDAEADLGSRARAGRRGR